MMVFIYDESFEKVFAKVLELSSGLQLDNGTCAFACKLLQDQNEGSAAISLPSSIFELIAYIEAKLDHKLTVDLHFEDGVRIRDKVHKAVNDRLLFYSDLICDRIVMKKICDFLLAPKNLKHTSTMLYRTVDNIWKKIGDKSTDFNYYTKRGSLFLVYSSSLFYFARDASEGFYNTQNFVTKRINNVLLYGKLKNKVTSLTNAIK